MPNITRSASSQTSNPSADKRSLRPPVPPKQKEPSLTSEETAHRIGREVVENRNKMMRDNPNYQVPF